MAKSRTVRFALELEKSVDEFLKKNNLSFNTLVNLAVKEFMSKPHTIELEPINPNEWTMNLKKSSEKHKKSITDLS